VQDLDARDRVVHDRGLEAAADDLDLGKLGHDAP
jgi:hypothetical protein